jgi:hypothetical protein
MKKIYLLLLVFLLGNTLLSAQMVLNYETTETNTNIYLPLFGTVNVSVDWGDGSA